MPYIFCCRLSAGRIQLCNFLMFLLTLLKYVPLNEEMLRENLSGFLPNGIAATINNIIVEVNDKTTGTLLSITIIILLWTILAQGVNGI